MLCLFFLFPAGGSVFFLKIIHTPLLILCLLYMATAEEIVSIKKHQIFLRNWNRPQATSPQKLPAWGASLTMLFSMSWNTCREATPSQKLLMERAAGRSPTRWSRQCCGSSCNWMPAGCQSVGPRRPHGTTHVWQSCPRTVWREHTEIKGHTLGYWHCSWLGGGCGHKTHATWRGPRGKGKDATFQGQFHVPNYTSTFLSQNKQGQVGHLCLSCCVPRIA